MNRVFEEYFNPSSIELAFHRVKCWPDKMVKDQVGLRAFGTNLEQNCNNLSKKILKGDYIPERGFKFYMPKASKTTRTKTLLFIEDALVYQAIANKIAQNSYETLKEHESFVFGSVLSESTKYGTRLLEFDNPNFFFFKFWKDLYQKFKDSVIHSVEVDKVKYKFETDITGFFDCIPHYNLLLKLSDRFNVEDEILDLLSECLNTWSGTKESMTPGVGIPQGCPPSFLLANLLLHDLDEMVISKGLNYYRYMDDIKIYAYEEKQLLQVLVSIDKYLKGNGLSINSKKTSIEKIEEDKTDETVKAFKKLGRVFMSYDEESGTMNLLTEEQKESSKSDILKLIDQESKKLSEQDASDDNYNFSVVEKLESREEIIEYWYSQLNEVEEQLPYFFNELNEEISLKIEFDDIDLIIQSSKYGKSIRALREMHEKVEASDDLLKYWLFAYKTFFWRANNFGFTLSYYKTKTVFDEILNLINTEFQLYEWNRYFAYMTLSFNYDFSDKELRQLIFPSLSKENSDLAKISIYRLLFTHVKGIQLMDAVKKELAAESNFYLKILIAEFNRTKYKNNKDIVEFLNSIGL